jgi:hypothetical protein
MKIKGPIVTLGVGLAVGVGLLIANGVVTRSDTARTTAAAASSTSLPAPTASKGPAPTASKGPAPTASKGPAAGNGASTYGLGTAKAAAGQLPAASRTTAVAAPSAPGSVAAPSAPASVAGPSAPASAVASTAPTASYVGKVTGAGSLAIVTKGSTAAGYVCDGKTEAWLWGTVVGNRVVLKDAKGDTFIGTRGGGPVAGDLTVKGRRWTFAVPSVKKPAGLYRSSVRIRGKKWVTGWVVQPDGSQVGLSTPDGGAGSAAPPIDLATGQVTIDGAALTASPLDPSSGPA